MSLSPLQVQSLVGEELESDKYLITVEDVKTSGSCSGGVENTNPSGQQPGSCPSGIENTSPRRQQFGSCLGGIQSNNLSRSQLSRQTHNLPLRQPLKRRRTVSIIFLQALNFVCLFVCLFLKFGGSEVNGQSNKGNKANYSGKEYPRFYNGLRSGNGLHDLGEN